MTKPNKNIFITRTGLISSSVMSVFLIGMYASWIISDGVPLTIFYNDFLFTWGEVWKLQNGLQPYTDFFTPLGPLYYWLLGFNSSLSENYKMMTLVGFWPAATTAPFLLWVLLRRTDPTTAVLICMYVISIPVAPRLMGVHFSLIGQDAYYNTISLMLIAVVAAVVLPTKQTSSLRNIAIDGIIGGLCIAIMSLTKVSYGVLALAMILGVACVAVFDRSSYRLQALVTASVAAVTAIIAIIFFIFMFPGVAAAYVGMISEAVGVNSTSYRIWFRIFTLVRWDWTPIVPICVALVCLMICERMRSTSSAARQALPFSLIATGILATGLVASLNDHSLEISVIPIALLFVAHAATVSAPAGKMTGLLIRAPAGFCAFLVISAIYASVAMPIKAASTKENDWGQLRDSLSSIKFVDDVSSPSTMRDHALFIEASELVLRHGMYDKRVFLQEFANALPFLLGSPPPRGQMSWYDLNRTFSMDRHPEPTQFYGDSQVVVVPRNPKAGSTAWALRQLYDRQLSEQFTLIATSTNYELWQENE